QALCASMYAAGAFAQEGGRQPRSTREHSPLDGPSPARSCPPGEAAGARPPRALGHPEKGDSTMVGFILGAVFVVGVAKMLRRRAWHRSFGCGYGGYGHRIGFAHGPY